MEKHWFLYLKDRVQGPYSTTEIESLIQSSQIETGFVWWKGQQQWTPIEEWHPDMQTDESSSVPTTTQWHLSIDGVTEGPYPLGQLLEVVRPLWNMNKELQVRSSEQVEWSNLFHVPEILELLGLCMRVNERVPLSGSVTLSCADVPPRSGITTTVSIGGLGVSGIEGLRRNEEVKIEISSPDFNSIIHAQGRIAYVNASGEAGILFERLHPEYQSILMDYVRRRSPTGRIRKTAA